MIPTHTVHTLMRTRIFAVLLFAAPLLAAGPCEAQDPGSGTGSLVVRGTMVGEHSRGGRTEHVWIDTGKGIEVRAHGEIALSEDGREVERVSEGGYLIVQQQEGGAVHRAEWRPADGGMRRSYSVDGTQRSFEEARPWLGRFLPEVASSTSIGARARFERVLARRGVAGVLAEAEATESASARQVFLEGLLERDLTPSETERYLRAAAASGSSSTTRDILLKMAAKRTLSAGQWDAWLQSAGSVSSSSDRRDLLRRAVAGYPREQALPGVFFRTLDGMGSSSDRRDVLRSVLASRGGEPGTALRTLASTAKLGSSSDRRDVLRDVAKVSLSGDAVSLYLQVVGGTGSSSDRREALTALLSNPTVTRSPAASVAWLGAVKGVGSDSDRASLLLAAVDRLPTDREVRTAFADAVETLSSDSNYNRVAGAFLRSQAGSR